jgi:hypothetical protein
VCRIALRVRRVQQAEAADDGGVGVREEGERDVPTDGKVLEDRNGVIADRGDLEAATAECLDLVLQLDQLALAVRSPVGGPDEEQDQALWSRERSG